MPYTRAFSTLGCPDATLSEALGIAARHGLAGVEVRALAETVNLPEHFAGSYGSPSGLADSLRDAPARVVALDSSFTLAGSGGSALDELIALIPWADSAGIPFVRVFDGGQAGDEHGFRKAVDNATWWRRERERQGWRAQIMVETHGLLSNAEKIRHFLSAAPGTPILWDSHYTWRKGRENPLVTWRAIGPHVVHIHLKDSAARPGTPAGFAYVPPGQGEFPMAPLRAALLAEFAGTVSFEWERLWFPDLAPLESVLVLAEETGWW